MGVPGTPGGPGHLGGRPREWGFTSTPRAGALSPVRGPGARGPRRGPWPGQESRKSLPAWRGPKIPPRGATGPRREGLM